jgi:hypothetical protein
MGKGDKEKKAPKKAEPIALKDKPTPGVSHGAAR